MRNHDGNIYFYFYLISERKKTEDKRINKKWNGDGPEQCLWMLCASEVWKPLCYLRKLQNSGVCLSLCHFLTSHAFLTNQNIHLHAILPFQALPEMNSRYPSGISFFFDYIFLPLPPLTSLHCLIPVLVPCAYIHHIFAF